MSPRVTVLMAVHNGERYLREAVDSVLGQTFTDFEFVVVDDGSTDRSAEIVASYGDPRVKLLRNGSNLGLTASLNRGLDAAAGEYVARMDSDDVSLPRRLAEQVAFMDARPEVAVSGTWATDIDGEGNVVGQRRVPVGEELEDYFWRPSPIIHPSAIMRAAQLRGLRYDPGVRYAQDFDLWLRVKAEHRLANLPECLLRYRVHDKSITGARREEQLRSVHRIICRRLGLDLTYDEALALLGCSYEVNPARRMWVMARTARAVGRPYRRFVKDDLDYARAWLDIVLWPRLTKAYFKRQLTRVLYSWRRVKPHAL